MARVLVGCKLPNGIVLEHPEKPEVKVTILGLNKRTIIGSDYMSTDVDGEFWDAWIKSNAKFPAVKSGAIFVAKDLRSLEAAGKEAKKRRTGLEPMQTDGKDPRAGGVKTDKGD